MSGSHNGAFHSHFCSWRGSCRSHSRYSESETRNGLLPIKFHTDAYLSHRWEEDGGSARLSAVLRIRDDACRLAQTRVSVKKGTRQIRHWRVWQDRVERRSTMKAAMLGILKRREQRRLGRCSVALFLTWTGDRAIKRKLSHATL